MALFERIAGLRKENKLSQEDVAEALGVSRQAVSKWETGRSYPDTQNLLKLAALFGVPVDALVGPEGESAGTDGKRKSRRPLLAVAAVVILAAVGYPLLCGVPAAPSESPSGPVTAQGAVVFSPEPSEDQEDPTLGVYLAFVTLSKGDVSAEEEYESRRTIYLGLRDMDWAEYAAYGETGKDDDTRFALLSWLAAQDMLSAEELGGLIAGMENHGIDGAYAEPYAAALSNALIAYPVQFVRDISALDDAEYARQVCRMAVYGACGRLDEAKAAVDAAVRSGALDDAEDGWAVYLNDCFGELYPAAASAP